MTLKNIIIPETIETESLRLVKSGKKLKDAKELYYLINSNREHLLPWIEHASKDDTGTIYDCYTYLEKNSLAWDDKSKFEFFIKEKESDTTIGMVAIFPNINRTKQTVNCGFWLAHNECRKGHLKNVIDSIERVVLGLGFDKMSIITDAKNIASNKAANKLGYINTWTNETGKWNKVLNEYRAFKIWEKSLVKE